MISPSEQPGYFGPTDRPLFGWMNVGCGERRSVGIVFCGPLGYESIPCHRTIRAAAASAANRGFPTLRFDFDGMGDSAGQDIDVGRVATWLAGIDSAIAQLKEAAGVASVCLWGFRFGATLASLAAQRRDDVVALIAVEPVVNGRQYLRQLRALALAGNGEHVNGDIQEAAGFVTTAETRASINAVVLDQIDAPAAPGILLQYRDDLPFDDRWLQHLRAAGRNVTALPFNGYTAMMLDAHEVVVPSQMIETSLDWLLQQLAASGRLAAFDTSSAKLSQRSSALFRVEHDGAQMDVLEEAICINVGVPVFAVVSQRAPTPGAAGGARRQLLILLNSGSVHHVGPNRVYVALSRHLASLGMTVVRLDLPGLGDSPARPGTPENLPYSPSALTDIQQALRELKRAYGPADLHVGGICSGAYHSLKTGLGKESIRSIVVINPLTFCWKQGMTVQMPESLVASEAARYRRSLFTWALWKKVLTGRADISSALHVIRRRVGAVLTHAARDLARELRIGLADDIASDLRRIANRHIRVVFVFSSADPGLAMLHEQAGRSVHKLERAQSLSIITVENADHTFTARRSRRDLLTILSGILGPPCANA